MSEHKPLEDGMDKLLEWVEDDLQYFFHSDDVRSAVEGLIEQAHSNNDKIGIIDVIHWFPVFFQEKDEEVFGR